MAAKLGDKDPSMNPRLRAAIQSAKQANMPKDNIKRAISRSEASDQKNYESLRYEGFGPFNVAFIIEALTDNKNRSASSIRTILQKNGGRLGESGSTSHLFFNCGIIHIDKKAYSDDEIFEMATNFGAKECFNYENYNEIISEKEDFYKIKSKFENQIKDLIYSGIEWRPLSYMKLSKEQSLKIIDVLETLEEIDDVQNIFLNVDLRDLKL